MGYDERRDEPENIIDAGMRGIARGLEGLRGIMSQIADPTASPRAKPVGGPGRRPPRQAPRTLPTSGSGAREPAVDVFDEGETIRVVADMPGADPATLQVLGAGNRLTIAAAGTARRYERVLVLPAPVRIDADGVAPTFINGVMEVLLPAVREEPSLPAIAPAGETGPLHPQIAQPATPGEAGDAPPPPVDIRPVARQEVHGSGQPEDRVDDRDEAATGTGAGEH